MRAEDLDEIIAEQAAQQQVLLMALRRIAALSRQAGQDPAEVAACWISVGRRELDAAPFSTAPGHEEIVRAEAKNRLVEMIEIGLR